MVCLWLLLPTNQVNIPAHLQDIRTETHIGDQGRGRQGSGRCSVDVFGVLHQERSLFHQAAGDADVVDAEEAAARERDVPRRVQGKHAGRPSARRPQWGRGRRGNVQAERQRN